MTDPPRPNSSANPHPQSHPTRALTVLLVVAVAILAASVVTQVLVVFVLIPQQIQASEPIVIDESALLNDGPNIVCFTDLSSWGGVFHQGQPFSLVWNVAAPANLTGSCTIQSIDAVHGPVRVTSSNLPVTIRPGDGGGIQVFFAPLNSPYWGGVSLSVVVTDP
jgi:hypothetical protein